MARSIATIFTLENINIFTRVRTIFQLEQNETKPYANDATRPSFIDEFTPRTLNDENYTNFYIDRLHLGH